ncbi:SCP2 sterol-binding domain-containing protein [Desulfoscipio geothermicus]|uniref:SCP-2 sterol transfer family protein n=1 Tax=Desulfoscipio geothermicus DSM 3669 TaxID=1121426 RepID=A0A1I6E4W0_9FIRM|nr:SCP2 sterol-binding domain-containing protein [Desulfoscipio geothermicus]SFR12790.1 SCP-2 sterol transfer family protein [Desulfoscipio geothermicus DSM 3669]
MATHEEITGSLQAFGEGYQKNKKLKIMNKDWDRVILIKAADVDSQHTLILKNGELTVTEGTPAGDPDLVVTADSETLADLFYGDITPTEPYMNGTLVIKGSEDDIVRLDFISLMIWGE